MNRLEEEINKIKEKGRYRTLKTIQSISGPVLRIGNRKYLNFSSNNYLGLSQDFRVKWAAIQAILKYGSGSGASRLISGNMQIHEELERAIARFKGTETAIVFSTGYMANLGVITAIAGSEDVIILDRLNHASIIEASRLSKAKILVYPHNDVSRLEEILKSNIEKKYRRNIVITESLFSMDGDIAPIPQLLQVCKRYGAIFMIDEAHATGVLGENGQGALEHYSINPIEVDIVMGTLSKALGSLGGYVGGRGKLMELIINQSKPFIYTTGLAPAPCGAAIKAIKLLSEKSHHLNTLKRNTDYFYQEMEINGFEMPKDRTPIIPIAIGEDEKTMKASEFLFKQGIYAPGIRPPTVPEGEGRLRISLSAMHQEEHIDVLLKNLKELKNRNFIFVN